MTKQRVRCDQCEALMINGVFCHETRCPNAKKRYDVENDTWYKAYECFNCGREVEDGQICECNDPAEDGYL